MTVVGQKQEFARIGPSKAHRQEYNLTSSPNQQTGNRAMAEKKVLVGQGSKDKDFNKTTGVSPTESSSSESSRSSVSNTTTLNPKKSSPNKRQINHGRSMWISSHYPQQQQHHHSTNNRSSPSSVSSNSSNKTKSKSFMWSESLTHKLMEAVQKEPHLTPSQLRIKYNFEQLGITTTQISSKLRTKGIRELRDRRKKEQPKQEVVQETKPSNHLLGHSSANGQHSSTSGSVWTKVLTQKMIDAVKKDPRMTPAQLRIKYNFDQDNITTPQIASKLRTKVIRELRDSAKKQKNNEDGQDSEWRDDGSDWEETGPERKVLGKRKRSPLKSSVAHLTNSTYPPSLQGSLSSNHPSTKHGQHLAIPSTTPKFLSALQNNPPPTSHSSSRQNPLTSMSYQNNNQSMSHMSNPTANNHPSNHLTNHLQSQQQQHDCPQSILQDQTLIQQSLPEQVFWTGRTHGHFFVLIQDNPRDIIEFHIDKDTPRLLIIQKRHLPLDELRMIDAELHVNQPILSRCTHITLPNDLDFSNPIRIKTDSLKGLQIATREKGGRWITNHQIPTKHFLKARKIRTDQVATAAAQQTNHGVSSRES